MTKTHDKKKFERIFYPIAYFALVILFVVSGCYAFEKLYYEQIYVSGTSMIPTLIGDGAVGGRSHYGKADKSRRVVDNLKRFDVVITYFPSTWSSDEDTYKIKRVWGFPGETLNLTTNDNNVEFTVTCDGKDPITYTADIKTGEKVGESTMDVAYFKLSNKTFRVNVSNGCKRELVNYKLENGEYFLMGDNWPVSLDSYKNKSKTEKVTNSLIQGRVVQILGTAQINGDQLVNKEKIIGMYEF